MAKSFCLLTELQALQPSTSGGGWWKYISYTGSGSATIQSGNTCANPCTSTMPKNPADKLGGASSGCDTCTGCTVTTSNPCVTMVSAGVYVFQYSVKCVSGNCCIPSPNCTSLLTITLSDGPTIVISSSSQDCTETLSITKNPTEGHKVAGVPTSSTIMDASITTQMCTLCGAGPQQCAMAQNWFAPAGKICNGFQLNLRQCQNSETCELKSLNFTAKRTSGLLVTSPTYLVSDYFASCTSGTCIYYPSNPTADADIETFYTCVITAMLNDFKASLVDPSMAWELTVDCSGGILTILLANKNIVTGDGHWIGFLKNPVTDTNGVHPTNTAQYRNTASGCNSESTSTASADTFDCPNTVAFSGNLFGLSCLVIGGTPFLIRFGNIINTTSSDAFNLVANSVTVWNFISASIPGFVFMSGSNPLLYTKHCIANVLTANVTGCGSPTYVWSNGATSQSTSFPHNPSDPTECVSVKACCGTCCACAHVCLTNTPPYVSSTYTGNCSSGCSNNSTCP